jgi:phage tail protein X
MHAARDSNESTNEGLYSRKGMEGQRCQRGLELDFIDRAVSWRVYADMSSLISREFKINPRGLDAEGFVIIQAAKKECVAANTVVPGEA